VERSGVVARTVGRPTSTARAFAVVSLASGWHTGGVTGVLALIVAFAVVALLALMLRWTYGTGRISGPSPDGTTSDFGLLHEVAVAGSAGEANALRAVLSDASIRSTTADAGRGRVRVLVFAADVERARALVGPGTY